jgi:small subunit ribosomal protein S6
MRRYEQIYILRPSLSEDEITTIIQNTNSIIEGESGSIIFLNKWGMKKLAYPIKKELQGYYVFCDFATTPAAVSEVERKFRIDDSVLKYLTVKLSDSISPEEITAAQEEAAVKSVQQEETAEETADESTEGAVEKETAEEDAE